MKAKDIVVVFLFMIGMQSIGAQLMLQGVIPLEQWGNDEIPKAGYFKDVNGHFNKFIGTWEYNGSDKHLKIQFYKVEKISISDDIFYDRLCSFIEYKEKQNGQWVTIYNTFDTPIQTDFNFNYNTIQGSIIINPNFIVLKYTEPSEGCRAFDGSLRLTYQVDNPPQLVWQRGFEVLNYSECDNVDISEFKIPANLVLTKIIN